MDATQHSVKIGPEFFLKAFNDYSNRYWAFVREILQNAMDSKGCRAINISTSLTPEGDTLVEVSDDGSGMDRDTLTEKLLSLGSSGKGFAGTVGGFGKAKELLFFCHRSYAIQTQFWSVSGVGGQYTIQKSDEFTVGCKIRVVWAGNVRTELDRHFAAFLGLTNWAGTVYLQGTHIPTADRPGKFKAEVPYGRIYERNDGYQILLVRVHGVPMFRYHISYKKSITIELKGSYGFLTSNRDGLSREYADQLSMFIQTLSVNASKAFGKPRTEYVRYDGDKLCAHVDVQVAALQEALQCAGRASRGPEVPITEEELRKAIVMLQAVGGSALLVKDTVQTVAESGLKFEYEFIIKNTTGMVIPSYYKPGEFGKYAQTLARYWMSCMLELHRLFEIHTRFAVGFCFDADAEAQHEQSTQFGTVYYLNPSKIVTQASGSRSLKNRFKLTDRYEILAVAVHELVHGMGYGNHDEDYASKLTDVMAVVMRNMSRFSKCFK